MSLEKFTIYTIYYHSMKLNIELVPSTQWYNNIRKVLPKKEWDKLRRQVYRDYNYKCGVCGAENCRISCHEIWSFDDSKHIQKLDGFIALCDDCHMIKHIGLAGILANEGKLDYEKLIEHFLIVNECNREEFDIHRTEAFTQWMVRSSHEWMIDFGEYEQIIKKYIS